VPVDTALDVWRVSNASSRAFCVCLDREQWQLDLSNRITYRRMLGCLDAAGARQVVVFRPQQGGTSASWPITQTEELATRAADSVGLIAGTVALHDQDVYASFSRR
jgi:hypothetical protein